MHADHLSDQKQLIPSHRRRQTCKQKADTRFVCLPLIFRCSLMCSPVDGYAWESVELILGGGLVDFTGPAWVDGTKSKPEAFLSAEDTALLKSKIFSNSDYSLKSAIEAIEALGRQFTSIDNSSVQEGITFENVTVQIQSGTISSDYDARRAGELALEEMMKIARRTTNIGATRR